jgi:cobalt/nickel transport system permease protein
VHRLDPRVKIIAALAAIIIVTTESLSGRLVNFAVYSVIILVVTGCSRIPFRYLLKRILILSPFILMAALFYPVSQMQIRELTLTSDWRPLAEAGLSVFLKAFLALLILLLLSSTEKFHRLLRAFRWLKVPAIVTTLSALLYRYIFLLYDERLKTARARESRTPGVLRTSRVRVFGNQAAVIFYRSWERSQLIYQSMLSRGFAGEFPETQEMKLRAPDIAFSFLFIVLLLLTRIVL